MGACGFRVLSAVCLLPSASCHLPVSLSPCLRVRGAASAHRWEDREFVTVLYFTSRGRVFLIDGKQQRATEAAQLRIRGKYSLECIGCVDRRGQRKIYFAVSSSVPRGSEKEHTHFDLLLVQGRLEHCGHSRSTLRPLCPLLLANS